MPGVQCKAFERDGRRLRLVQFARGFKEPDWCRKGHIGYVLEGEGELQLSDQRVSLKAGDGIFLPAGGSTNTCCMSSVNISEWCWSRNSRQSNDSVDPK